MVVFKIFTEILDGYGHHTLAWMAGNILFAVDISLSVKLSSVFRYFVYIFAPSVTHIEVVIYQKKKISLVLYDLWEKLHNIDQLTRDLMNNSI